MESPPRSPTPVLEIDPDRRPIVITDVLDDAPSCVDATIDRAQVNARIAEGTVYGPNELRFSPDQEGNVLQCFPVFAEGSACLVCPRLGGMTIASCSVGANPDAAAQLSRLTARWAGAAGATGEWLPAARASERAPDSRKI